MNDQELMSFAIARSNDPIIKNKVLRDALDKDLGPRTNFDDGGKVDEALDAYNYYLKTRKSRPSKKRYKEIPFTKFFEIYGRENFSKGGPLTGDKFKEIVTKYPDKTNQELLDYFNKNKFTNRSGDPLTTGAIKTQKSKFFDIAAETKSQTPKGYISSTEVFENLPISKEDYFRVKQAKEGGTLLTKEIDKLLKPVKIGDTFYFKKPGKNDSRSFSRLADKTGRLNNRIADLMLDFDTTYGNKFFSKGNVPDIDDVAKKFNITDSTAGKVTTRLAQWYGGQDFKNPQLKDLKRNKVTSNRLFKTLEKSGFGNPYRNGLYQISMQTIDAKLGNKQGTFEKFKSQAKQILKDNKIPVYNPAKGKDAFGFNINEIAGVTGSAKSKAAEFSQFVDVMEGNINTKAMAGFQSKLSTARAAIEKDPTKLSVESKKINKMAKNLEKTYGVQLPRLRDPDATKFFSPTRLKELNAQGLDIVKAAERAGYTVQMPKNAMTITEFTDPKNADQIKTLLTDKEQTRLASMGGKGCNGNFAPGGPVSNKIRCITKALDRLKNPENLGPGDKLNARKLFQSAGVKKFGNFLKGFGIPGEILFESAFAIPNYLRGESGKRILGDTLLGLVGVYGSQSSEEEFLEYAKKKGLSDPTIELISDVNRVVDLGSSITKKEKTGRTTDPTELYNKVNPRGMRNVYKAEVDETNKIFDKYTMDQPQAKQQFNENMFSNAMQLGLDVEDDIQAARDKRIKEREEMGIISNQNYGSFNQVPTGIMKSYKKSYD